MIRCIVAGSRDYTDAEVITTYLDHLFSSTTDPIAIISGCCRGPDAIGILYAKEKGYGVQPFPANWKKYGKKAGPIRNEQMAKAATHCVVFWDGKSRGTKNMIDLAKQYNLVLRVKKVLQNNR